MALRVRIESVTYEKATRKYNVYSVLYDDAGPVDVASKTFVYSTVATDDQVRNAVTDAFKSPANAYMRRGEVKTYLTNVLATLVVPTTFEPMATTTLPGG